MSCSGLNQHTVYHLAVQASNQDGTSPWSEIIEVCRAQRLNVVCCSVTFSFFPFVKYQGRGNQKYLNPLKRAQDVDLLDLVKAFDHLFITRADDTTNTGKHKDVLDA